MKIFNGNNLRYGVGVCVCVWVCVCVCVCVCVSHSDVSDSAVPWTVAHQAPLSMDFSGLKYWNG